MIRRKTCAWAWPAIAAFVVAAWAGSSQAIEAPGRIEAVTVYRGQALVTRVIDLDAPAGSLEVVVTELPAQIIPDSLYAGAEGPVEIRAVRYRARAVQQEPREELRKIEAEIEEVEKLLRRIKADQSLLKQKRDYLTSLEGFTAGKVKEEMAKGTLNADTIKSVSEFIFQQRAELSKGDLDLVEEQRLAQQKLALLQRQKAELASRFTRTAREAVVFLDKRAAARATLRLNYLVGSANWSPTYNLRSGGPGKEVGLEYNALVQQMSGEDWDKVRLTLSTASPAMLAEGPILTPLWVTLTGKPPPVAAQPGAFFGGQKLMAENLKRALEERQFGMKRPGDQFQQDWAANEWANRLQFMDLVGGKDLLLAGREAVSGDLALSVNYALPAAISIPSRSDQQMIQIASLKLQGEFYYLAVPVLTPYVYQEAEVLNTSDVALLSGPVNSYMDGQFMGTGRVPMVAKGQRFTVGFGVDTQLRSTRELADKTDRIQGGNRELTFKYRLLVDNYKDRPVKVRLLDRLPDPKGADVRVTLLRTSQDISDEPVYLRTLRRAGILRWEIDVPAKASGASAKMVEYEYKLEFDRNLHLAEPTAAQVEREKVEFQDKLRMMQAAQ